MLTHIPKISSLSKRIIHILGCNPGSFTLQGTNTYIIGTGKRRLLLDTGEKDNKEYLSNLSNVLKEKEITLERIIVSHWHPDHIGGLNDVLRLTPVSDSVVTVMKFPRQDEPDSPLNIQPHQLSWLKGGEEIKVEGATLEVFHTPGHTTDHVVLNLKEENAIFSGDCILGEGTAVFEDLFDYMKSLKVILDLEPLVIYPGHGPVISNPVEKVRFYIDHRNEREGQIMQVFLNDREKVFTPMDIVKIIYVDTPSHLHQAAAKSVKNHLEKLLRENKIKCEDRVKSLWKYNDSASSL